MGGIGWPCQVIYASVLLKHVKSLELFNISPIFCCKWCFNPQYYLVLSQAKQLHSLSVSFPLSSPWPIPGIQTWTQMDMNMVWVMLYIDIACYLNISLRNVYHQVSSMIQLSVTSHFLTKVQINVAKLWGWQYPRFPAYRWSCIRDFAHHIRLGISNFSFPDKKTVSPVATYDWGWGTVPGVVEEDGNHSEEGSEITLFMEVLAFQATRHEKVITCIG